MTTCVLETVVYGNHAGLISTEFNDPTELILGIKVHREESLDPCFGLDETVTAAINRLFDILEREIYYGP